MKFRTEINIKPFAEKIDHQSRIFSIGSCFARYMAEELQAAKISTTSNPVGVLFNPASIASVLKRFSECNTLSSSDLQFSNGQWFSYNLHTSFSCADSEVLLSKANGAIQHGHESLTSSNWVIITFGTAWVYTLNESEEIVANCHKQPTSNFTRRRLSIEEIVAMYDELMRGVLAGKNVIFTVSPIRHLGDGADENFLSKSILKVAVAEIVERFENAHYFPAYEILNDDLRDYRFYAEDMCHPSAQARQYIRDKFFETALSVQCLQLLPRIEKITASVQHRPLNPNSDAFKEFCRRQIQEIETLPQIDFCREREYFASFVE